MSKQKLTASQKRVNLFLCFCVRVLNVILKIVTCIASKVIPGTTDRIKGTTFSCYTHTHTHTQSPSWCFATWPDLRPTGSVTSKTWSWGFPGGAVVESLPANAGDGGSSPGLGGSHVPRSD